MFKTRLISGIVLVLIAFGLLYTGGYVLAAALGIISLIGMFELNRTVKSEKSPLAAAAYLAAVVYYMLLMMTKDATVDTLPVIFFVAFLIVLMAVYVFSLSLIHILKGVIDTVSISLNTPNPQRYLELTRSKFGIQSFEAMLAFAKACKEEGCHVVMTTVATTLTKEEEEQCAKICKDLGVTDRIRHWED